MKVLGIETSTKSLSVAVVEDENLLLSCDKIFGLRHSRELVPTIKELLGRLSLNIKEIDGFAVSLGPGSFTGLRVGVTAAKTLALISKKPVVGVPTLDLIACNAFYYPGAICPVIDARKQMVYAALYEKGKSGIKKVSGYLLLPIEKLLKKISKKTLFIGDGITIYGDTIKKVKKSKAEFAPSRLWLPKAENVAHLGEEKLRKGKKDNVFDLVPMYLHAKECNIRR